MSGGKLSARPDQTNFMARMQLESARNINMKSRGNGQKAGSRRHAGGHAKVRALREKSASAYGVVLGAASVGTASSGSTLMRRLRKLHVP